MFARAALRGLSPEQLLDSVLVATGYRPRQAAEAGALDGNTPQGEFLAAFDDPAGRPADVQAWLAAANKAHDTARIMFEIAKSDLGARHKEGEQKGEYVTADKELAGMIRHGGHDAAAKADVRTIFERTGYFPVDLGTLDVGGPLTSLPFGALAGANLIKI